MMAIRFFLYAFGFFLAYYTWWGILFVGALLGAGVELVSRLQNRSLQHHFVWLYWGLLYIFGKWIHVRLQQAEQMLQLSMDIFWLLFLGLFTIGYMTMPALYVLKKGGFRIPQMGHIPQMGRPVSTPKLPPTPPPDGKEWKLITFDIGVDKTKAKYRLGGR